MKGLLIKDFQLMMMQKRFLLLIVLMAVFMSISMSDITFVVGYFSFVLSLFALTTVSYDEFDNGNPFLFTLPISRPGYVAEKYCLTFLCGIGGCLFGVLLSLSIGALRNSSEALSTVVSALPILAVVLLFLSVMLPLQIKFGAEKGRIAMIAVGGSLFVLVYAVMRILARFEVDPAVFLSGFDMLSLASAIIAAVVLVLLCLTVSVWISMRIMQKKEF